METEDPPLEEYGAEEELEPLQREESDVGAIDTDDLEDELAKRKRKKRGHARTWQYVLTSTVAGFLAGGGPSVYGWIDAQAEKVRTRATVEALAAEKLSSEAAYTQLSSVLSAHAKDLDACKQDLGVLRTELAVFGEWKRIIEQRLNRRFNLRMPANVARGMTLPPPAPHPPAAVPTKGRPKVEKDDPRVQRMKIEILNGTVD